MRLRMRTLFAALTAIFIASGVAFAAEAEGQIPGSLRVLPDQIREWAAQVDPSAKHRRVVAYCT